MGRVLFIPWTCSDVHLFPVCIRGDGFHPGGRISSIRVWCCCQSPRFLVVNSFTKGMYCSPLVMVRNEDCEEERQEQYG